MFLGCAEWGEVVGATLRAATLRDGFAEGGESTESVATRVGRGVHWKPFDWLNSQYYVSQPTRAGDSSSLPHSPKEPPGQRQSRDLDLTVAGCEAITADI
jgi:hypothetical protein